MWGALAAAGLVLVGGTGLAHAGRAHGEIRPAAARALPVRDELRTMPAVVHRHGARLPDSARVGPLFGTDGHHCTAGVVGEDLILTAAHCAPAGKDFVPGFHGGHSPYGWWHVMRVYVSPHWTHGEDEDYDVALAQIAPHGKDRLGDVVGYNDLGFDLGAGVPVTVIGYPSGRSSPVTGQARATRYNAHQLRVRIRGLAGGTSGGPWIGPDGEVIGVIGGHEEGGDQDDVSYSVYFGDSVETLYQAAS